MLTFLQRHPSPPNCPANNSNNHRQNMLMNRPFGARHLVPTPLRPSQHQVTGPLGSFHKNLNTQCEPGSAKDARALRKQRWREG